MSELVNYSTGTTVTAGWLNSTQLREEGLSSYVVYKAGATYYAKSLLPGGTDYSGTNQTTVVQQAINALTTGIIIIKSTVTGLGTLTQKLGVNLFYEASPILPYNASSSYTVWTDGANIHADSLTNGTSYFGPDAAVVLNNVFTALSSGGRVLIKNGTYGISSAKLVVPNNYTFVEAESQNVILQGNPGSPFIAFNGTNSTMRNVQINNFGSGNTAVSSTAISFLLDSCLIISGTAIAVALSGSLPRIANNSISNFATGIQLNTGANGAVLHSNLITTNVASAKLVDIEGADTALVFGNDLEGVQASTNGVYLNYGNSISKIIGNRMETLLNGVNFVSSSQDRVSLNNFAAVTNPIAGSPAVTVIIRDNLGFNPQGWATTSPAVPSTGVDQQNTLGYPVIVYITGLGSGVTAVGITDPSGTLQSFTRTGEVGDYYRVDPGGKIRLTYTGSPTWRWYGL